MPFCRPNMSEKPKHWQLFRSSRYSFIHLFLFFLEKELICHFCTAATGRKKTRVLIEHPGNSCSLKPPLGYKTHSWIFEQILYRGLTSLLFLWIYPFKVKNSAVKSFQSTSVSYMFTFSSSKTISCRLRDPLTLTPRPLTPTTVLAQLSFLRLILIFFLKKGWRNRSFKHLMTS